MLSCVCSSGFLSFFFLLHLGCSPLERFIRVFFVLNPCMETGMLDWRAEDQCFCLLATTFLNEMAANALPFDQSRNG